MPYLDIIVNAIVSVLFVAFIAVLVIKIIEHKI